MDLDVVKKSGAWYSFNEERIGQGRENTRRFLAEHPDMMSEINKRVSEKLGMGQKADTPQAETQ